MCICMRVKWVPIRVISFWGVVVRVFGGFLGWLMVRLVAAVVGLLVRYILLTKSGIFC